MKRYCGEPLPPRPRIAVVSNDAIGNYVVVTPLLQMLRSAHQPAELHYFSGPRTQELWSVDPKIDAGCCFLGMAPREAAAEVLCAQPYDLVVNVEWSVWAKSFTALLAGQNTFVCGPSLNSTGRGDLPFPLDQQGRLWQDQEWISPDLVSTYPFLRTGYIGEIFCRLAYLLGEVPLYDVPSAAISGPIPDVLIAMSASLEDKLWPLESWVEALSCLRARGLSVGLLGAKPSNQSAFWLGSAAEAAVVEQGLAEDLRGQFTLPQVVGALGRAKVVLTLDNGILHLSCAAGTPTVGLFREGIHRLWAPPAPKLKVLAPLAGAPVSSISVERVLEAIDRAG